MDTIFAPPSSVPPVVAQGCGACFQDAGKNSGKDGGKSGRQGGQQGGRRGGFDMPITMAFQPIVRPDGTIFAHEALVRGAQGEGAASVLAQVTQDNLYAFDQLCRTTAIQIAGGLGLAATGALLSINFSPKAIYEPDRCIASSLAAAKRSGLANESLMFEITENERLRDAAHLKAIVTSYSAMGFRVAIDDFGAGFSNLDLLADFQPDIVKLDMALIRNVDRDPVRRAVVGHLTRMMAELRIEPVAEGVETIGEYEALRDLGLFPGYLFARPRRRGLATLSMPRRPSIP
jgi:EAL domain-containing protein (putative c-di-GMP-specific phosphodiesterase class I)